MNRRNCLTWIFMILLTWASFAGLVFIIWVLFEQGWLNYGL